MVAESDERLSYSRQGKHFFITGQIAHGQCQFGLFVDQQSPWDHITAFLVTSLTVNEQRRLLHILYF